MENKNKTDEKTLTESVGVTETQIRKLSEFDLNVIKVLRCLVPDQQMKLEGNGDCGFWESKCIDVDGLAITNIKKNDRTIVKIIYDYDSGTEQEFWEVE